ncbi:hypothetical protein DOM22_02750 [Bdellovibrio sp. ZAP7]|uniref:hypothetical protein n=1 Tax=Bdellovibrio sp. ZAP7 TaxID=2231053 RepID=UPI001157EFE2|nr:hypothetical protein [Bdellovibrio sp. ZAP7]QDK44146.1 hypothetical protein DOM22_02750 [Bdellovibrio sp. ZAP7]
MKTMIALSILLLSSASFAKSYEGLATITLQRDVAAQTPDSGGRYIDGITMGKPECVAYFTMSHPFSLKKGTRLQVLYRANEKEVWADGDSVTNIPTNGYTMIAMSYEMADGYYLLGSASCNTSKTLFPRRGLPTLNKLLEKASPLFTIELQ